MSSVQAVRHPGADRLGVTFFGSQFDVVDLRSVWEKAGISEPLQSVSEQAAPVKIKHGSGVAPENLVFQFVVHATRADLLCMPNPTVGLPTPRVLTFASFEQSIAWIKKSASALLDVMPPSIYRVAVQASFILDFDGKDDLVEFVRGRIPQSKDVPVEEDFIFQINRQTEKINRIVNWQTGRAQGIVVTPDKGAILQGFWIVRQTLDFNNKVDQGTEPKVLSQVEVRGLLNELVGSIETDRNA